MALTAPTKPASVSVPRPELRLAGKVLLAGILVAGLLLLLLVLAGVFTRKVPTQMPASSTAASSNMRLAEVHLIHRQRSEAAVGTIRAVHEAAIASRLLARITEVRIKAGQPVTAGEVLVRLDDADLQARLKQAEAAVRAATAAQERAASEYGRARQLLPGRAISQEEFDRAAATQKTAAADLTRAEDLAREAATLLDYATIRAPITGIVVDKRVEAGDTASPGQVLLTLYNPKRMQMVVTVRESLALRLKVGQKVDARLDALGHQCQATVSEIVPEAQAASRSFTVKVTGPCPPGAYTGMFGRIFIPLDDEQVVVVPAAAVVRVGQLDMVRVLDNGQLLRRSVQLGRRLGDDYEVLAGLKPGEQVALESQRQEAQP